ncbi:MAG: flagellar type III secretion system protein FlhB [Burkholderiales bacterium]|nr:flagellar type III secretion system protein FlhB [Burkholderiales bacterium]
MAEDSDLERTEPASAKRIQEAREEGQVPHSRELSTFALLLAAGGGLWAMGSQLMGHLSIMMMQGLTVERALAFDDPMRMIKRFYALASDILLAFLPFFALMLVAVLASPLLLNGWVFSLKPLQPNFEKLNPMEGMGRIFSLNSLVELGKAILKTVLIGGIAVWVIWYNRDSFMGFVDEPLHAALAHLGHMAMFTFFAIMGGMALIVAVDVPYQLWSYNDKLKMTKEELRKESKETEGSPEVKGRIRRQQREMARRRMMAEIPKADVVVTNPTHYAVALRYQENMGAPKVVASGAHLLASRIREVAQEHSVPILEAPPLARALYFNTEIGDEIPESLYAAVAEVLAYVYQVKRGIEAAPPSDLPVPSELDPGETE